MANKQLVIRTYPEPTGIKSIMLEDENKFSLNKLNRALNDGYIIKSSTPFLKKGTTIHIEYILEKQE